MIVPPLDVLKRLAGDRHPDLNDWQKLVVAIEESEEPFDGKTEASDGRYTAKDNMIVVNPGKGIAQLWTTKEFPKDFELRLEYKMSKHSNSGVALRTPVQGDPAYVGMEIQLIDDLNWKGLQSWQHTGSIYNVVPAKKIVNKDIGEWNQYEITCKGDTIKLVVNDQLVNEGTNAEATKGKILLQSEGAPIVFRNVEIKMLK